MFCRRIAINRVTDGAMRVAVSPVTVALNVSSAQCPVNQQFAANVIGTSNSSVDCLRSSEEVARPSEAAMARAEMVKRNYFATLAADPAVLGVGVGAGEGPGEAAIVVFVKRGKTAPPVSSEPRWSEYCDRDHRSYPSAGGFRLSRGRERRFAAGSTTLRVVPQPQAGVGGDAGGRSRQSAVRAQPPRKARKTTRRWPEPAD